MDGPDVYIHAVGTALPGPAVDNATLVRRFGLPTAWVRWIDAFVGTDSRHFALDLESGEVRYSLADMGSTASEKALTMAGFDPLDIDVMVMGSATPDKLLPASVNMIADRLGISGVPTYQLLSGCTGAIQALDLAGQMLQSGRHRTALVVGADTCARHLNPTMDLATMSSHMRVNVALFGDGAGAAVLSTLPAPGRPILRRAFTRLVGQGREPGQVVEWFGYSDLPAGREPLFEDFKAVENHAPPMAREALEELLDNLGWKKADLAYILPPQLSGKMTQRVLDELTVPGAVEITCVTEVGNTVNALPFFQMERVLPKMAMGDRAAGVSVEASKWIKAGYALEMGSR